MCWTNTNELIQKMEDLAEQGKNLKKSWGILKLSHNATFGGAQGISMANKEIPDLIILDIRMPDVDGFSVVEKLKQSDRTSRIPIIFLTGSPERDADERAMGLGVRFYIKKPYDPEELLDAVERALERVSSNP